MRRARFFSSHPIHPTLSSWQWKDHAIVRIGTWVRTFLRERDTERINQLAAAGSEKSLTSKYTFFLLQHCVVKQ
jgi:hypothetical protein